MTIEESNDLNKMGMDELIGCFLTYEMMRKAKYEEVKVKRDIVLNVDDEKEKEGNSSMDNDDISLLARKFNKFLSSSKKNKGKGFV